LAVIIIFYFQMGCASSKDGHGGPHLVKPTPVPGVTHCGPWLKHPEDITDFPEFPENFKQSLCCKALTKDVWNEYKDLSDKAGVSFKTCILSGC
jgi:hypothetical protein